LKDYETMSLKELRTKARNEGIKYYYRLKKAELIKKLKEKNSWHIDKEEIIKIIDSNPSMAEVRKIASILGIKLKRTMKKIKIISMIREKLTIQKNTPQIVKSSTEVSSSTMLKEHEPQKIVSDTLELPKTYNKDKLVCLPVNPYWIHIYWDFSTETLEKLKKARSVKLRVYDITYIIFNGKNAHRIFEVDIDPIKIKNYYFSVPNARADYIAEIGYKEDFEFIPILRSNLVETPPSSPGNMREEIWVDLVTFRKSRKKSEGMILKPVERPITTMFSSFSSDIGKGYN